MVRLVAFSLALVLATVAVSDAQCFPWCRFRFCDNRRFFRLPRTPDRRFTSRICAKYGRRIGVVGSTGEALLVTRRYPRFRFTPISKWSPRGLKQRFSPSFFKAINSGIAHETVQQNQGFYLNRRCFIVPITAYQLLDKYGRVKDNIHPRNPRRDCVAFYTRT